MKSFVIQFRYWDGSTYFYPFTVELDGEPYKFTPLVSTGDGRIWLAACIVSLSSHTTSGHITMHKAEQAAFWEYPLENPGWVKRGEIVLSEREKEILSLSAQGYTIVMIASKLHTGDNTLKTYRGNLFKKLGVKNITEALLFARNYKLLYLYGEV